MEEKIKNNENNINKEDSQKKDVRYLRIVSYSSIISFLIYYGILFISLIIDPPSDGDFLTGIYRTFVFLPIYFIFYIFISIYLFNLFSKKYNTSYKTGTYFLHFLFYSWFMFLLYFLFAMSVVPIVIEIINVIGHSILVY